ncbi:MAG: succinyl-diaminopimelate desuccinylase [Paracoccaceae bacterium]|nr:succinyl-diaminopimelate desuccinylase [Paracoccaceae bacterium]
MFTKIDPINLTAELIRCQSVTPTDGGALKLLSSILEKEGFDCHYINRGGVLNLFAIWGRNNNGKTFGFNGHTDVVPVGDKSLWTKDPFGGEIKNKKIWGRGACDMKSAVASFVAAAVDYIRKTPPNGSIVIAITGDEEGDAIDGTRAILDWMEVNNIKVDSFLVGEPTSVNKTGDTMKIGRRGSMTVHLSVKGKQGHSAYPHLANNPIPGLAKLVNKISSHELDQGNEYFDPSNLSVTTIDTGNNASNVIPAETTATVNIRFNDLHSSGTLKNWLLSEINIIENEFNIKFSSIFKVSGESFLTLPNDFSAIVEKAIKSKTGITPELSTSGGTSDARFIKNHAPVVEVGLVGKTMHQTDEHVDLSDIEKLKSIYSSILENYFA